MKRMTEYTEHAKQWIKENNLKERDYVRVTRRAENSEGKWWNCRMDKPIGKVLYVEFVDYEDGSIFLGMDDTFYDFPYFILEKVENPKSEDILMSSCLVQRITRIS